MTRADRRLESVEDGMDESGAVRKSIAWLSVMGSVRSGWVGAERSESEVGGASGAVVSCGRFVGSGDGGGMYGLLEVVEVIRVEDMVERTRMLQQPRG